MIPRWTLSVLAVALVVVGSSSRCQAQAGAQILVVSQGMSDKSAGDPVEIGYYVCRAIDDAGRYASVQFKASDQTVLDAVKAGKITDADVAAPDSNASMRRVASALGIRVVLFVTARQTKDGLIASAQEEAMSGPEAWRTVLSKTLAAYKRGSVVESIRYQANALARAASDASLDDSAPANPAAAQSDASAPSKPAATAKPDKRATTRSARNTNPKRTRPDPKAKKPANQPPVTPPDQSKVGPPTPVVATPNPNALVVDENQADRYRKLGDTTNMIFYLRRAINVRPRDAKLRRDLIKAYRDTGKIEAAKSEAGRAVAIAPADASLRRMLGDCLVETGDSEAALKEFEEAIRLDPKDPAGHLALGDALWNAGKPDDAEKAYLNAVVADPSQPTPLRRLARVYAQRGRYADCANAMKTAIRLTTEADALNLAADYAAIIGVVENGLNEVVSKLQRSRKDALDGVRSREDVFKDIAAIKRQAQGYSDFLSSLPAPQGYTSVQGLYAQAAALGVQAAEGLMVFLESRNDSDEKDATILRLETVKQIAEASKRLKALTSRSAPAS